MIPLHRRRLAPLALAGAIALAACIPSNIVAPKYGNPAAGKRVLFIGNSLTYVNDLPRLVQGLADAAGGDSLIIAMYAGPDKALIDHWGDMGARRRVQETRWDYLVLQQGPSSTAVNRDTLRLATTLFHSLVVDRGGKAVLFSAWPTQSRMQDYERAAESYRLAAEDVGGLYAPVAKAWLAFINRGTNVSLYSPDGLHPTLAGSYLAALVLYAKILGKSPVGLPATIKLRSGEFLSLPPETVKLMQECAWEAIGSG